MSTIEDKRVIAGFAALANDVRLAVFQTLVPHAKEGLSAGILAERIGVAPSKLSFHIRAMTMAGLLRQRRMHRNLIYAVDSDVIAMLSSYLAVKLQILTGQSTELSITPTLTIAVDNCPSDIPLITLIPEKIAQDVAAE